MSAVKVVLPDNSELELPEGATGLDAARAIGPKLAEQAVLVRSNGAVRDLRLPLGDHERIQLLTIRDKDDPDANGQQLDPLGSRPPRGLSPSIRSHMKTAATSPICAAARICRTRSRSRR